MTTIEISETILGPFARPEDAQAMGQGLVEKGWPVVYLNPDAGEPNWHFDTLADYRRFMADFEAAVDERSPAVAMSVSWACDCEDHEAPCPHGDDPRAGGLLDPAARPPLDELYGLELRKAVDDLYPGLRDWLRTAVDCLFGAVAFGHQLADQDGAPSSAAILWLREEWPGRRGQLETYDRLLQDLAALATFATHDAWLSEQLAAAGLAPTDVGWCETCEEMTLLFCKCKES